jgi:methyl coenzyme M reductase subunit D
MRRPEWMAGVARVMMNASKLPRFIRCRPMTAAAANRFERRRVGTRQALVRAARQILAESGTTGAGIQCQWP